MKRRDHWRRKVYVFRPGIVTLSHGSHMLVTEECSGMTIEYVFNDSGKQFYPKHRRTRSMRGK